MKHSPLILLGATLACGDSARGPAPQAEASATDPTDPTVADTSTTGETEVSTQTEPGTGTQTAGPTTETDTTGPAGCQGPQDCDDPASPFCIDGLCVACSAAADPDQACAQLDALTPLCVDDGCVQCTAQNTSACSGSTPLCNLDASACAPCEFHEQCQDIDAPACNLLTGACFDSAAVSEVDAGVPGSLQDAIDALDDAAQHAIVVNGDGLEHTVTVDGGKTIAIASSNTSLRAIDGQEGNPTITISGSDTTVFLHRLRLEANGDDVGISVEAGASLFADSIIIAQNSGGGISLATGTSGQLRNCMVAGDGGNPGIPAVISNGAELSILYSTLGLPANFGGSPIECSGGAVSLRNSIVVNESNAAGNEVDCPGSTAENSSLRTTLSPADWFGAGFASGNYSLTTAGQSEFMDVAIWEDGDPPFNFEGHPRPATDGSADYPGADAVP